MTSRTVDIHCNCCGTYLFSLQPDDYDRIAMDYYCDSEECKEQAVVDELKYGKSDVQ